MPGYDSPPKDYVAEARVLIDANFGAGAEHVHRERMTNPIMHKAYQCFLKTVVDLLKQRDGVQDSPLTDSALHISLPPSDLLQK